MSFGLVKKAYLFKAKAQISRWIMRVKYAPQGDARQQGAASTRLNYVVRLWMHTGETLQSVLARV